MLLRTSQRDDNIILLMVIYEVLSIIKPKGTTMQKMARRHNLEGGNHLKQESNIQRTMEDIDGGLIPAVDGQILGER